MQKGGNDHMEKIFTSIVTIALTFTMSFARETTPAFTQPAKDNTAIYNITCTGYTDADYDGFCDNCNTHHDSSNICPGYADADNNGFCDNCNTHHSGLNGGCSGYVDADNDGFCDNCNTHHDSSNICPGYADADNNGFCDNCNTHHSGLNGGCSGYVDANNDGFCDNHAYGEYCPYAPSGSSDTSGAVTSGAYCGRHHRNSGHHSDRHH